MLYKLKYYSFNKCQLVLCRIIKGDGANFSSGQLSSIDIIQPYAKPTNVWLLSISCLYISVHPLVWIKFKIWHIPTACSNLNSPKWKPDGNGYNLMQIFKEA